MILHTVKTDMARHRLSQLVRFLREFHQFRNPVVRDVFGYPEGFTLWLDQIPDHSSIAIP